MDGKKLRNCLRKSSMDEFLHLATKIDLRTAKTALKTLIWGIPSNLSSQLLASLHVAITHTVDSFKNANDAKSPSPPPPKRPRRSSRKNITNRRESVCPKDNFNSKGMTQIRNMHIYVLIVRFCMTHPKKLFSPSDLLPSVQSLHDSLVLCDSDSSLMSEIAGLCEDWWKDGLIGRETLISQSLPFLVARSLQSEKKVDLHRVYALREALCLFDFSDDSIDDLKHLLIRCVVTSLYLKVEEGRRFVAFLFGLNSQLMKETLAVIRAQIPFGRKSILEAFGDILFRAWKASEADIQKEIEDGILQNLVEGAIYAKTPELAASIRRVLGGFINQRTADGVEKLLFHLVEPILFRSLQVANSSVRQNALHVLLDMFPLEDPDAIKEARDTVLEKQFFLLDKLLLDECPLIRLTAVEGTCRILRLFWEVISPSNITKLLAKIIDDMSHDVCSEVRVSVLNGLIYLLENPQSHELLKVLLPRLRHLFLDHVLAVRVASVDLLLAVRDLRNFQFTEVVCLDMLLSFLASDSELVAKRITRLLLPSYFPSKVTSKEACSRCVSLIQRLPLAGARFCEFAFSEGSSMRSIVELAGVCAELALLRNKSSQDESDGFFIATCNLCQSLANENSVKSALNEVLSEKKLRDLFEAASTSAARVSILKICSVVSPAHVAGFLDGIVGMIVDCADLHENKEAQERVKAAHLVIVSCGKYIYLIEVFTQLLQVAAAGYEQNSGVEPLKQTFKRKKLIRKKIAHKQVHREGALSKLEKDYAIASGIAWQIKEMLSSIEVRKAVLGSPLLDMMFHSLKVLSEVNIKRAICDDSLDISPILALSSLSVNITVRDMTSSCTKQHCNNLQSLQETILDDVVNHLILCVDKLLETCNLGASSQMPSICKLGREKAFCSNSVKKRDTVHASDASFCASKNDSCLSDERRTENTLKIATAVLKFISDAAAVDFVFHSQEKALYFTLKYFRYLISILYGKQNKFPSFGEVHFLEIFVCIRSSITYAAKLLKSMLSHSGPSSLPTRQASELASIIFDLIAASDPHLSMKHVEHIIVTVKPWLPDLILGLGCHHVHHSCPTQEERSLIGIPPWIAVLAKAEFMEVENPKDGNLVGDNMSRNDGRLENHLVRERGALRKLIKMAVELLKKGNQQILDAVGVFMLRGAIIGAEMDTAFILGLVHFVCTNIIEPDYDNSKNLGMVLALLKKIYVHTEKYVCDWHVGKEVKHNLERVKSCIEAAGVHDEGT